MTSAFASGSFNARLIADGVVSFAFVPIVQIVALAAVTRMGTRRAVPFPRLVDLFFAGNAPWLFWMALQAAIFAVVPPRSMSWWFDPLTWTASLPMVWSLWIDVHFFERVSGRTRRAAIADAFAQRAIAWPLGILYFFGIGIYSVVLSWMLQGAR
jgi:hypothetical protein